MYHYKLKSTNHSSRRYGNCEVCGKFAETVWYQIETKNYKRHNGTISQTHKDCHDLVGHYDCLKKKQKI